MRFCFWYCFSYWERRRSFFGSAPKQSLCVLGLQKFMRLGPAGGQKSLCVLGLEKFMRFGLAQCGPHTWCQIVVCQVLQVESGLICGVLVPGDWCCTDRRHCRHRDWRWGGPQEDVLQTFCPPSPPPFAARVHKSYNTSPLALPRSCL